MQPLPPIIQIGSPELHAKSIAIQDFQEEKIADLVQTLKELLAPNKLIGVSAPQIGINKRIFVTNVREPNQNGKEELTFRVYINPVIISTSPETIEMYEGCGSVLQNNLFGPVSRPTTVTVEAFDLEHTKFRLTANGILARVILHEFDHLEGILFTEKVADYRKLMSLENYIAFAKTNTAQKEAYKITTFELS